jgi:hypothetical protein
MIVITYRIIKKNQFDKLNHDSYHPSRSPTTEKPMKTHPHKQLAVLTILASLYADAAFAY